VSAPRPILIHGSGGDHRVWELQSARLAGAMALDLPGHPDGEAATDLDALAEACAAAIAVVDPPRVLVGHSLGGAIALEVARRDPGLVAGVVVVAGAARLPVPDVAVARAREDFAAERERLLAGSFADPAAPMARVARAALDSCGPETLAADYAACRTVQLRGRLGGIRVPVLVVVGSDDPFTPPWIAEELARELPMSRMVVIPGARHMPMAEFDMTVTQLIAAYLARLELTLQDA
jgi:pimeloyl-ACP methyl ester carboxylesterase